MNRPLFFNQRSRLTHGVDMTSVLAESSFSSLLKQVCKNGLYSSSMFHVRLIEGHHVNEDHMTLVHEEVAKTVEAFSLAHTIHRSVLFQMIQEETAHTLLPF